MAQLEWRGDIVYREVESGVIQAMNQATLEGVRVAHDRSRKGPTLRYSKGWAAVPAEVQGTAIHAEIINEAENDYGHMYPRYVSAGTSKMAGDFAHAAALDEVGTVLPLFIPRFVRLS